MDLILLILIFITISPILISIIFVIEYFFALIFTQFNLFKKDNNPEKNNVSQDSLLREYPKISVIIPTYNEEEIIKKKLDSIFDSSYKGEIIVHVVDESTDKTPDIIKNYVHERKNVHLHHFTKRMGYNNAILKGIKYAQTELITITDSHSFLDKHALEISVKTLMCNEQIGGVYGRGELLEKDTKSEKVEKSYMKFFYFQRRIESKIHSPALSKGEIFTFKKHLMKNYNSSTGSFDNDFTQWIVKKGFKVSFCPNIIFREYFPSRTRERLKQKIIRAASVQQVFHKYSELLLNPRFGSYGLVIFPFNYYQFMIMPLNVVFSTISLLILIAYLVINKMYVFPILIGVLLVISLLIPRLRILAITIFQSIWSLLVGLYICFIRKEKYESFVPKISSTRGIN